MKYNPFCSTEIKFGKKDNLKETLLSLDAANIVLVLDESLASRWDMITFVEELRDKCNSQKGRLIWVNTIPANPTQKDIINSLKKIAENKVEIIIAISGGSGMDLAKAISAFYSNYKNSHYTIDEITDSIKNKNYIHNKCVDIIAVPSTAGTGSEVTQWATIWDENGPEKFSIDDPKLKPKLAFIVPELTLSLSLEMTLATGLDAMCQAIEVFWAKATTPIVQEIAYRAVELVIQNLRQVIDQPDNLDGREKLCRASVLAGIAFSQTRTTACHSISYPLTSLYNVPHGLAASITLDAVGKINKGYFENDDAIFALFAKYGGIMNWIDLVCDGVIKMRLSEFGITKKDIPVIVENAFTAGRMDNNPVDLSKDDVAEILTSIM